MTAQSSSVLGVNVDRVTAGTTTDGKNAEHVLGTTVFGSNGNEYRYVQASGAISTTTSQPLCLCIDESNQAAIATGPLLLVNHRIGFAPQQIIADNSFFWARMKGTFPIRVAASCAADAPLRITAAGTGGRLTSASLTASGITVLGVVIVTVASASTSEGNTVRNALAGPMLVNIRQTNI